MRQSGATKFPVTVPAYWWRSCAQLDLRWGKEKGRALAFSARTYEIIKSELLTGAGASSLTMTAQQCMQKVSRTMFTYSGSNADKEGKEYFSKILEEPLKGIITELAVHAKVLSAKIKESEYADTPVVACLGDNSFRWLMIQAAGGSTSPRRAS